MPVTEHAQRRAARADALVTAQLAFALNGYSFDGLAERHRQTLNREALLRQASTPLQRYCLLNNCEPWECLAAVLNRFRRREDGLVFGRPIAWLVRSLMGLFTLPTRRATRYFNPCSVACFYQSQYMPRSFNTCVQWD